MRCASGGACGSCRTTNRCRRIPLRSACAWIRASAFGTGTHPSTALCLTWLDSRLLPASTVIDYGCGSGVLALAAAKLGARAVHAFDIDPQALIATRDNAAANGSAARIHVHEAAGTLPAQADVVMANILAGTLVELARSCARTSHPADS